jgi:hypothetical protein
MEFEGKRTLYENKLYIMRANVENAYGEPVYVRIAIREDDFITPILLTKDQIRGLKNELEKILKEIEKGEKK